MMTTDKGARKQLPLFTGCLKYFPDAWVAVAELSRIGNDQHNPGKELFWDRSKSQDELDALMRHLVEAGTIDVDGVRHSTKVAWRALANLQKEIENARASDKVIGEPADNLKCSTVHRVWGGPEDGPQRNDTVGSPAGWSIVRLFCGKGK